MAGLFDMPSMGELRRQMAAENTAAIQQYGNQPPGAKGIGSLIRGIGGAFGFEDPRMKELKEKQRIMNTIKSSEGIDFNKDPVGAMRQGAQEFWKRGYFKEALEMLQSSAAYAKATQGKTGTPTKLEKYHDYKARLEAAGKTDTKEYKNIMSAIEKESTRQRSATEVVNATLDSINKKRVAEGRGPVTNEEELAKEYPKEYFRIKQNQKTVSIQGAIRDSLAGYTKPEDDVVDYSRD